MNRGDDDPADNVARLLDFHDETFIIKAYEVILGRSPDAGGLANYLTQVRNGVHRGQIIAEIAQSEEGAAKAPNSTVLQAIIRRHGKRSRFSLRSIIERLGPSNINLAEQRIRALENKLYLVEQLSHQQTQRFDSLSERLRLLADRSVAEPVVAPKDPNKDASHNLLLAALPVNVRRTFVEMQNAIKRKRAR